VEWLWLLFGCALVPLVTIFMGVLCSVEAALFNVTIKPVLRICLHDLHKDSIMTRLCPGGGGGGHGQTVNGRPLATEARIQSQASPRGICGSLSGPGTE
jgi:hypothetical protein